MSKGEVVTVPIYWVLQEARGPQFKFEIFDGPFFSRDEAEECISIDTVERKVGTFRKLRIATESKHVYLNPD